MPPCKDDEGHVFNQGDTVCAPTGVILTCNAGEWTSTGTPCAGTEPRPRLHALFARAHNLLQPPGFEPANAPQSLPPAKPPARPLKAKGTAKKEPAKRKRAKRAGPGEKS
jgi:hypothetical protein